MTNSRGEVFTIGNAVCMHEEDFGILWKHTDWRTNAVEVRRSRRLVVSFIATVANYEYGFYWYFYQDGTIALEVKLSGIMNTTALMPGEKPVFGTEVAPQLNAPYHQHFFGVRLDMNVDGAGNSVYEVNTRGLPEGDGNPYGNAFRAEAALLANESEAQRTVNTGTARFWRVENPSKKNSLGVPTAYRLVPGENCWPFAQSSASLLKRAGFLSKNLWVTKYDREEKFPAGNYPNQNPGGDGLPKWSQANRDLVNTNVVLWYTFGHNHVPRMEDWPVMPVSYIGFSLKPDGFFEGNPAIDLPPSPSKKSCCH
jgi:primary-amine oxidase